MMKKVLCGIAALSLCSVAFAVDIPLLNADFETNSGGAYSDIDDWGPNGSWAPHVNHVTPNNGSLGAAFGYYSAGLTETMGQITASTFDPDLTYTFAGWAVGGGNDTGVVPFQIGYRMDDGSGGDMFVELATMTYDITGAGAWQELAGVSYTTGATGPELGNPIWVRLGDGTAGGSSDIWFDSFSLSYVPEPASIMLLTLGLFLRRR